MATKAKEPVKQVRITAKQVQAHREKARRDPSPSWDGSESWSGERFTAHFREAMKWYNLETNSKTLKPQIINWMAKNGYTKTQITEFKKTRDGRCVLTMGAVASCLLKGMPPVHEGFNKGRDTSQWLGAQIAAVVTAGKNDIDEEAVAAAKAKEAAEAPAVPVTSIQDRVNDAARLMTAEIEDALEQFHTDPESFDPKAFKILNLLRGKGVKAAHARIIKDLYARETAEIAELLSAKPDPQLIEGYKHRTKKQIKNLYLFLTEIQTACTMLMEEAKVMRKPRTPKAVSKDKLVEKLKYKKQDDTLKLVSINPVDIIGAKELWIYNTKTRKLGKYVAKEYAELGIKGTAIINFDEDKSIQKTLRKPAEQIAAFKAAGKVALRKILDEINSVDTKMNGRISEEIMLLKVQ
jgi:hypothetical protein